MNGALGSGDTGSISKYFPSMTMSVTLPSLLMKTTVSQPFTELLGKKIIHQNVELNKRIQLHQMNLLISCSVPRFVKKAGPNMIPTTVQSITLELP